MAPGGGTFDDLRDFMAACQQADAWRQIDGADWDLEIGALTEAVAELIPDPPMLIFDRIPGYPAGHRVLSLWLSSWKRAALALGLPLDSDLNRKRKPGWRSSSTGKNV